MKIYLLRHGETIWNKEGRMQGHQDIPLSETGLAQVKQTAERVKGLGEQIDLILSSPLVRARTTAEIVACAIGYPKEEILIEEDLIERSFGEAEGSTPKERAEKYPDKVYPDMETAEALCERARRVVDRCIGQYQDKTILLVAHGMIIKALMVSVSEGVSFDDGSIPIVGPASLNLLEYQDGKITLHVDESKDKWFQ